MASLALTTRFMITCSIWPLSIFTGNNLGSRIINNLTSSPIRRPIIFSISVIISFKFNIVGWIICLRLNASSWLVRWLPLSPAFLISSTGSYRGSSFSILICASWALPIIVVRMLLKSCATPPARTPIASIFWACRNCSFSLFSSVMSQKIPIMPVTSPCPSLTGAFTVWTHPSSPFRTYCSSKSSILFSSINRWSSNLYFSANSLE